MRFVLFLLGILSLACGRKPGSFPVPEQRSLDLGVDPGGLAEFITMDDPAADDYIVRDIGRQPGTYRWAYLHPELRFRVASPAGLRFTAQIFVPEVTFKVTGPVNVTYAVNGKPLGSLRCDHFGKYEISTPVSAGWLETGKDVHVTFETDRRWVAPEDGAQLSFLLFGAGFTR